MSNIVVCHQYLYVRLDLKLKKILHLLLNFTFRKLNSLCPVIGLDARGFLFGPGIAIKLGVGFVPVRKQGKLPGETVSIPCEKEYGKVLLPLKSFTRICCCIFIEG
jgi:adenine/guanine phosphoribosyltransferase-like PRPP-binding protein